MDKKNLLVSAGVALVVVVLGLVLFGKPAVVERVVERLGATPGNVIPGDFVSVNGIDKYYVAGNCVTSTSTRFSVRNPAQATSTATLLYLTAQINATNTTWNVGTSTLSSINDVANISNSFVVGVTQATSALAHNVPGVTVGTNVNTSGTGAQSRVVVGPGEYVLGYSTSTATGSGSLLYTHSACAYGLEFTKSR